MVFPSPVRHWLSQWNIRWRKRPTTPNWGQYKQVKGRTSLTKQEEILNPGFWIKEVQLTLSYLVHLLCCIMLVILQILKARKLHRTWEVLITKVLNSLFYIEFVGKNLALCDGFRIIPLFSQNKQCLNQMFLLIWYRIECMKSVVSKVIVNPEFMFKGDVLLTLTPAWGSMSWLK